MRNFGRRRATLQPSPMSSYHVDDNGNENLPVAVLTQDQLNSMADD